MVSLSKQTKKKSTISQRARATHFTQWKYCRKQKHRIWKSDIGVAVELFCVKARQFSYCTSTSKTEGQTNTSKLRENVWIYLHFHWKEPFVSGAQVLDHSAFLANGGGSDTHTWRGGWRRPMEPIHGLKLWNKAEMQDGLRERGQSKRNRA